MEPRRLALSLVTSFDIMYIIGKWDTYGFYLSTRVFRRRYATLGLDSESPDTRTFRLATISTKGHTMAERSLRGMKIGANSLESDEGVAFVDRKQVIYECPDGTQFAVAMATDAEPPATWKNRDGQIGKLRDAVAVEDKKPVKPPRTHWDMLMERRTEDDLKILLDERLELLRSGRLRMHRRK